MSITKYYIKNEVSGWISIGVLIIGLSCFLFFEPEHAIVILISFFPLMIIPLTIRSYIVIEGDKLYKYSIGGKNSSAEIIIDLKQVTKLRVAKRSRYNQISIISNDDPINAFTFKTESNSNVIDRLMEFTNNIEYKK